MGESVRNILISGGSSGIGYACAQHLAARGDRVWILGSREKGVRAAAQALPLAGAGVCDVADLAQVNAAVAEAAQTLGGLDGVFVNAGIDGQERPAADLDVVQFRRLLDVNVIGSLLVSQAAVRAMPGRGSIVFNASANALRPEPGFADYNASKAAVVSLAKTLAIELAPSGICVTALCPGYFPTRMTERYLDDEPTRRHLLSRIPAERFGDLDEIAALVDFLLDPKAQYMTGGVITIDGAATV